MATQRVRRLSLVTRTIFLTLLFINCVHIVTGEDNDLCASKSTCRDCIQTINCSWCLQSNLSRCYRQDLQHACSEPWSPKPVLPLINIPTETSNGKQISPQKIGLQQLRVGGSFKFEMSYVDLEDQPVDLYYLMDLSHSMEAHKTTLAGLSDVLDKAMKNITSKYQLGFGSFVDKVLMPYVLTFPEKLINPCTNDSCTAPYGFKNHMALSPDSTKFAEAVAATQMSGNIDNPEGGLDGIVQVIVCGDQIGWRVNSRRLLLHVTDQSFHFAGDGKLGGVVTPNDGLCHLDEHGVYNYSSVQDYPSIWQINSLAKKHSVNIIFAIIDNQKESYIKLSQHVEGSSFAVLEEKSANIVKLIRNEYEKIRSRVEMRHNATNEFSINFSSNCGGSSVSITNKCEGLKLKQKVGFEIKIKANECPPNAPAEWTQFIKIYPVGINESTVVEVKVLCGCDCEHNPVPGSPYCKQHGNLRCGLCECDKQYTGKWCQCSKGDRDSVSDQGCRKDDQSPVCSNRGTCECGKCTCNIQPKPSEEFSGEFCQFDNFLCERPQNVLCSGNGKCANGQCICEPAFNGSACDCPISDEGCKKPGEETLCSGNGKCDCGKCICKSTHIGMFCDVCPTCTPRCQDFMDCVQCQMYKKGKYSANDCSLHCKHPVIKAVANQRYDSICPYDDEDNCHSTYYLYGPRENLIIAADLLNCHISTTFIIAGVFGAIVLVGVATLLLWKFITTVQDRRDLVRFETEQKLAKWDVAGNPMFKPATTTFKNPTFQHD